jgi:hypothetical protein
MLRSAPRLRRDALLIRGPSARLAMGPGSAEQRHSASKTRVNVLVGRGTASGTRRRSIPLDALNRGGEVILLLCGGDKSSQQRDIEAAKKLAREED